MVGSQPRGDGGAGAALGLEFADESLDVDPANRERGKGPVAAPAGVNWRKSSVWASQVRPRYPARASLSDLVTTGRIVAVAVNVDVLVVLIRCLLQQPESRGRDRRAWQLLMSGTCAALTLRSRPRRTRKRRTPPSPPIISADGRIAAAPQLCADAPVLCDLLVERRTSSRHESAFAAQLASTPWSCWYWLMRIRDDGVASISGYRVSALVLDV